MDIRSITVSGVRLNCRRAPVKRLVIECRRCFGDVVTPNAEPFETTLVYQGYHLEGSLPVKDSFLPGEFESLFCETGFEHDLTGDENIGIPAAQGNLILKVSGAGIGVRYTERQGNRDIRTRVCRRVGGRCKTLLSVFEGHNHLRRRGCGADSGRRFVRQEFPVVQPIAGRQDRKQKQQQKPR